MSVTELAIEGLSDYQDRANLCLGVFYIRVSQSRIFAGLFANKRASGCLKGARHENFNI